MSEGDKITIEIQCQGEDGLINFLHNHGVVNQTNGWELICTTVKLTDKSKTWTPCAWTWLRPENEVFEFSNGGNEAILGLRFYFPIKIYTDDKLQQQDKFLVLELMKGNREELFLAYYDFEQKKYYPTNIKFKRGFKNTIDLVKYMFARFIKQNWIKGIISASVGVVLAVVFTWPYIFIGLGIFVIWVFSYYIRANCISVDFISFDLKHEPPQPSVEDPLKFITNTQDKDSEQKRVIPNNKDDKNGNEMLNDSI
ncbi:MAG: hypothetical protein IJU86_01450 [Firmicutes bacterium]|nr:hypothetical protein [Bacillota bacterium]